MILSKHDLIAGSLRSIREMVHRCNKHTLYIQQVAKAYRTRAKRYIHKPGQRPGKEITVTHPRLPPLSPGSSGCLFLYIF